MRGLRNMNTSKEYWKNRYTELETKLNVGMMHWYIQQSDIDFQNKIRPYIDGQQFDTVIDFGCGTGKNTEFLIDVFKARKYIGYDIVSSVLRFCRKKYLFGQFFNYKEGLRKSNVIWASFVLQHLDDCSILMVLKDFYRSLKENGKLYIIDCIDKGLGTDTMFYRNIYIHKDLFDDTGFTDSRIAYAWDMNGKQMALFEVCK